MRNMRSAWLALGLAGAAYAWRNRDRLQQQLSQFRGRSAPPQLPDYGSRQERTLPEQSWEQPRGQQFGGSDV